MLDLSRQYDKIRPEISGGDREGLRFRHYSWARRGGVEGELAVFTGATGLWDALSGSDALWLALVAAGFSRRRLWRPHPSVFLLRPSAIVRAGATGVCGYRSPDLEPGRAALAKMLRGERRAKLRAVLPVSSLWAVPDMDALGELAEEFQLVVIEDAAQAIGAEWSGQQAGALGAAAAFKFYPTKNLSAYGDAGAVTTMNADWAEHMRRLRNHGSPRRTCMKKWGGIHGWIRCRRRFCG